MTDYSLWEVILNGNKVLKRKIREVEQEYEPTTAEEKQDRRNEMKARETLLMALPNKDQLKFDSYKDAKLLMEAIEKSTNSNNSTNEADNTAYGISTAHTQSSPTSEDNLSDAVINLQWEMAMLTIRARRFIKRTSRAPRNQDNRGKDNSKRTVIIESSTKNALVAQDRIGGYDWSYQAEEKHPTNFALMAHTSSEKFFCSDLEGPLPYTGNFIPRKHDLTFIDEIVESENMDVTTVITPSDFEKDMLNQESAGVKNNGDAVEPKTVRKNSFIPPIIEDWNYDDESEIDYNGNPQQKEYKEKGVINSGCSRHMTRKKCYLTEYEDYDGGFVSFGDGKGRISGKVLSSDFKLLDETQVLLRVPRKDNIYSVDLKSVVPIKGLTCLIAKATIDESNLWHRRLGHTNFKNMNKLVRETLLEDETSRILKTFITEIENQLDHKVKVIRCDNGTEFKNSVMNQFCEMKGIKREFSVARTPQQNGVAERKNRTLIEAARTMLVDSKLPTTFWAEAVNTACYVLNRVLVIKPHNKTPYELIRGRPPLIDFMKPFGCPVTILNTRDHLGKFDEKADEGYFVGYSVISKAMRVFNKRTRIVEETLNIRFLENAPNVKGNGPDWLFDVDSLSKSMNYVPVIAGNQTNGIAGTKDNIVAGQAQKEKELEQEYILIPFCTTDPLISRGPKDSKEDAGMKPTKVNESGASDKGEEDDQ
ncbi:putative ribonuclease H-like domain-containing protein [Tanacetum coccineum]